MKIAIHLLVGISLTLRCLVSSTEAEPLRTVAFSGTTASGTDAVFLGFGSPALNGVGETSFLGFLSGPGVNNGNSSGIWTEESGLLDLIARKGEIAPGTSANFFDLSPPLLNNAGQTVFSGRLTGVEVTNANDHGIWSERNSSLTLFVLEGSRASGTSADFSNFGNVVLNNSGEIAVLGSLAGPGVDSSNDQGIWLGDSDSLNLVTREGRRAPGTTARFASFLSPVLNDKGQAAFRGDLTGSGVSSTNNRGIWSEAGGSLALIAREGSSAPGTSEKFRNIGATVVNDAGQTAFIGSLTTSTGSFFTNRGIWSEGGGSLALVARDGMAAPGTGSRFFGFGNQTPVLNGVGQVAFQGFLLGFGTNSSDNSGIWSTGRGSLALLARAGNEAPGTDVDFASFARIMPVLNVANQTAFLGNLTGSDVNSNNDRGIWAEDLSGVLTLIAREGDLLDVDGGPGKDFRTIRSLTFVGNSGNEDGRRSGFNALGQLAFGATFTDGTSGIFVSNLVAIPEPSTLVFVGVSGVCLLLGRRRL